VVVVTASTEVDSAVACLNEGALDYVVKPFQLEEVLARIRQALEKRSMKVALEQHLEELERRVVDLAIGNFQSWADMLEERDLNLRGHSLRVSQYAAAIGRELRMGEDMIGIITLGSRLHDIGKIGVKEACLHKAGRLTEEEYREIMRHPVIGAQLMSPYLGRWPTAWAIIRSHHERLDGKGLPDGLRGDAIPLAVRVVTVADSLDAMTSPRAYRPPLPVERALQELTSCKGQQFDPDAVEALFSAFPRAGVLPIATPVFEPVPLPPDQRVELPGGTLG
jgi:HD-GYP domain-containing protein (c-di-GMP phosphodiesterase class II)